MELAVIIEDLRPYAASRYGVDGDDLLHDAYVKILSYDKLQALKKTNTVKLVLRRMLHQLFLDAKRKQKEYAAEIEDVEQEENEDCFDYVINEKSLTFEQRQIAKQLMAGKSKSEVARYFGVSFEVIKNECKKMSKSQDWVTSLPS